VRCTDCLENVRSSTSDNPIGLHCLLQGQFFFLFFFFLFNTNENIYMLAVKYGISLLAISENCLCTPLIFPMKFTTPLKAQATKYLKELPFYFNFFMIVRVVVSAAVSSTSTKHRNTQRYCFYICFSHFH
jgi:hypothetical protein